MDKTKNIQTHRKRIKLPIYESVYGNFAQLHIKSLQIIYKMIKYNGDYTKTTYLEKKRYL